MGYLTPFTGGDFVSFRSAFLYYQTSVYGHVEISFCTSESAQTVDLIQAPLYIVGMREEVTPKEQDLDLERLETGIEELIQLCERLHTENNLLRNQQTPLTSERIKLIETNSLVRNKMEAVIKRLKTMEIEL